jgi:tRNA-(ms[2]io[6]A)-hydroxylase
MIPTPEEFVACATPDAWIDAALAEQEILLIDHAWCEKKAASTALALMFRYPDRPALVWRMSRLAREELRHFEQVQKILAQRGIAHRHLAGGRYAAGLHAVARRSEPDRLVDALIIGAFIEARSCERFLRLSPHLDRELADFYAGLCHSEARHFTHYLELAEQYASGPIAARIEAFATREAHLVSTPDPVFRFHSGVPVHSQA